MIKNTKGKKVVRNVLLSGSILLGSLFVTEKVNAQEGEVPKLPDSEVVANFINTHNLSLGFDEIMELNERRIQEVNFRELKERKKAWESAYREQQELKRIEAERLAAEKAEQERLAEIAHREELKRQEELRKQEELKKQESIKAESNGKTYTVKATFYTSGCKGCSGKTAMGIDVRKSIYYKGLRVIAVDPRYIKLGTIVRVEVNGQSFKAIAGDTGGAIKGANRIDILVATKKEAYALGIKQAKVTVLQ